MHDFHKKKLSWDWSLVRVIKGFPPSYCIGFAFLFLAKDTNTVYPRLVRVGGGFRGPSVPLLAHWKKKNCVDYMSLEAAYRKS